jgi:hypothetical protein
MFLHAFGSDGDKRAAALQPLAVQPSSPAAAQHPAPSAAPTPLSLLPVPPQPPPRLGFYELYARERQRRLGAALAPCSQLF